MTGFTSWRSYLEMLTSVALHSLKRGRKWFLRTAQFITASGEATTSTGMVYKNGPMALDTRACGKIAKLAVRASSGTWTAIFLKESGSMIKQMDLGYTSTQTVRATLGFGRTTCNMEREKNSG